MTKGPGDEVGICQHFRGEHSALTHAGGGVSPRNFQATQIYQCRNMYINMKFPETMQIEVRIASGEPKHISSTIFDFKNYYEHNFRFILTKKYHFWQCSNPNILDLPPRMCMC